MLPDFEIKPQLPYNKAWETYECMLPDFEIKPQQDVNRQIYRHGTHPGVN